MNTFINKHGWYKVRDDPWPLFVVYHYPKITQRMNRLFHIFRRSVNIITYCVYDPIPNFDPRNPWLSSLYLEKSRLFHSFFGSYTYLVTSRLERYFHLSFIKVKPPIWQRRCRWVDTTTSCFYHVCCVFIYNTDTSIYIYKYSCPVIDLKQTPDIKRFRPRSSCSPSLKPSPLFLVSLLWPESLSSFLCMFLILWSRVKRIETLPPSISVSCL